MPIRTEPMTINVGPQHPSTHGVFRLRVTFDGEEILEVEPIFGYLHRGTEKLAEERNYVQIVTLTDRLDYVSSMINNQAYCLAVEQLLGVEPPLRAKWLRTMVAELQRIASHLMGIGFFLQDLGTLGTPLMYGFRIREKILDLFEMLCGARITLSYMRPGGVFSDTPPDFWPALEHFMDELPSEFEEIEQLVHDLVPTLKRVSSGRAKNSRDWTDDLQSTGHFTDCIFMEAHHEIAMSHERYVGAWRSVNDIQAQAGPEKFKLLLDRIREKIADLDDVVVPYKTRAWTVTKKA